MTAQINLPVSTVEQLLADVLEINRAIGKGGVANDIANRAYPAMQRTLDNLRAAIQKPIAQAGFVRAALSLGKQYAQMLMMSKKPFEDALEALPTECVEPNKMVRLGQYVIDFAKKGGWEADSGEGAFEYIQRISYAQGVQDAIARQGAPRGWLCQSKKHAAQRCIAMNPQESDATTEVTPLYVGIVMPL